MIEGTKGGREWEWLKEGSEKKSRIEGTGTGREELKEEDRIKEGNGKDWKKGMGRIKGREREEMNDGDGKDWKKGKGREGTVGKNWTWRNKK